MKWMIWREETPKEPFEQFVQKGVEHFAQKYQCQPAAALVSNNRPEEQIKALAEMLGVTVERKKSVFSTEIWLGYEKEEPEPEAVVLPVVFENMEV